MVGKLIFHLILCSEAGLVGLIVFRDVGLVGGAVYQRASNLEWKVRPFSLCLVSVLAKITCLLV